MMVRVIGVENMKKVYDQYMEEYEGILREYERKIKIKES
jgi:hypothetical protein